MARRAATRRAQSPTPAARPPASQRAPCARSWKKAMIPGGIGSQKAISAVDEDGGEHARRAGQAEEHEGADHARRRRPPPRPARAGSGWRPCRRRSPGRPPPSGTWTSKAWKEAQRMPMLAAQKPIAPAHRQPAPRRVADEARSPCGCRSPASPGTVASAARPAAARRAPRRCRSRSAARGPPGSSAIARQDQDHDAGDRGRDDGQARRVGPPGSTPVRSRIPSMIRASR